VTTPNSSTSPGLKTLVSGDFFTAAYRMTGNAAINASGLFGLLNDKVRASVHLEGVYVSYVSNPSSIVEQSPTAYLPKSAIEIIVLSTTTSLGPEALIRGGFSRVVQQKALITTHNFEVRGLVELPGQMELDVLLTEGTSNFIVMYSATANPCSNPKATFSGEAIIINRRCVDFIARQN
jgi:hypothetical protein